jgi:2-phospho-L-lactate/phosphoenolpyruvate guanylyltransferase
MRTAAVLPVKRFVQAKQRLGESVADRLRLALAEAMVADVLLALSQTTEVQRTIVVTREASILDAARAHGATVIEDAAEAGQSAAAALGIAVAIEQGFERVLCVPGDCPALDPAELDAMLEAERDVPAPAVTIVPDRHGAGTNGLLLSPPDAIAPSFGPDSCERHRSLATEAGIVARLARPRSLLLDVDTGADLAVLRERLTTLQEGASRTRAVLGRPSDTLSAVNV